MCVCVCAFSELCVFLVPMFTAAATEITYLLGTNTANLLQTQIPTFRPFLSLNTHTHKRKREGESFSLGLLLGMHALHDIHHPGMDHQIPPLSTLQSSHTLRPFYHSMQGAKCLQ